MVDVEASNYNELKNVITNANPNTATKIMLTGNMVGTEKITLENKHIILTSKAETPVTIERKTAITLFEVKSGSLTIEGDSKKGKEGIVIAGQEVTAGGQLLLLSGSGELTIKNTTIQNAKTSNAGAVVKVTGGTLNIDNCLIKNCFGKARGGAIFFNNGNGSISNTDFEGNTTEDYGGAIWTELTAKLTVTNCNFRNNIAAKNGGAISTRGDSEVSVLVDGVGQYEFTGNKVNGTAGGYGAIYNASSKELTYSARYSYSENTDGTGTGIGVGGSKLVRIDAAEE